MKKYVVFALIFLLFFSFYFKTADASATDCRVYVNGACETGYHFNPMDYEEYVQEVAAGRETIVGTAPATIDFQTRFIILVLQFFGIVALFILLVALLDNVLQPKKSKK